MLIHKKSRKLILNVRDRNRILSVVPTAKEFRYKGRTLVAVPHRIEETRILRNLNFDAPSPIRYHYEWSGSYTPFRAQLDTAEFLTLHPRAFCLNDMGTGKTLSALWAYDYLRSQKQVTKALVISPLSTLERTWGDEIFRHFPHLTFASLHGTKTRRRKLLQQDVDVYMVNHDGIKVLQQDLIARDDIDLVVIDESASFRNAGTDRWKALKKVTAGRKFVWALSGTPTPNGPTDAWAQCRIVCPENVPPYYGQWRDSVMRQVSQFRWIPRDGATSLVAQAMQPAIRFSRAECVDLPECIYQERSVPLTPDQKQVYGQMLSKLAMEYNGEQVMAVNEAVKMQKLVQIACGVVYGKDTNVYLPVRPRIEVIKEVIEEAGTKTIVFVPFTGVLEYVAAQLAAHFSVACIQGSTSKSARDDIFHRFQNEDSPQVLVAQPAAMSHGLTLTAANTVVWFAPITSNEVFEQANARVSRPGQKHTQFIVMVEGTPVERRIYERLRGKQKMQGLLLETIRESR